MSRRTPQHLQCQNATSPMGNKFLWEDSVEHCPLEVSMRKTLLSPDQRKPATLGGFSGATVMEELRRPCSLVRAVKEGFRWGGIVWRELRVHSLQSHNTMFISAFDYTSLISLWTHIDFSTAFSLFHEETNILKIQRVSFQVVFSLKTNNPKFSLWSRLQLWGSGMCSEPLGRKNSAQERE